MKQETGENTLASYAILLASFFSMNFPIRAFVPPIARWFCARIFLEEKEAGGETPAQASADLSDFRAKVALSFASRQRTCTSSTFLMKNE